MSKSIKFAALAACLFIFSAADSASAAKLEVNRVHLGGSAFFQDSEAFSVSPAVAWAPRTAFGKTFYVATPLGLSLLKGKFKTSMVADFAVFLGFNRLLGPVSFELGTNLMYQGGAGISGKTLFPSTPRVGMFWNFDKRDSLISGFGLRWWKVEKPFNSDVIALSTHRFEALMEIRL